MEKAKGPYTAEFFQYSAEQPAYSKGGGKEARWRTFLRGKPLDDDEEANPDVESISLLPRDETGLKLDRNAADFSKKIRDLQKILHFGAKPLNVRKDSFGEVKCQGYLRIHLDPSKSFDSKKAPPRFYCQVVDTFLLYKNEESDLHYKGGIAIAFCVVESPAPSGSDNTPVENEEYDELYMACLESREGGHCFKLFTKDQIFIVQAESSEQRTEFVTAIQDSLKNRFDQNMWRAKEESAKELQPLYREQFVFSIKTHQFVLRSLQSTGLLAETSILRSKDKEKSGVLSMQVPNPYGISVWKNFFFVLLDGALYYFERSTDSVPKGFVALMYAHMSLDADFLSDNEYVFRINTPLRSLCLKAKHPVALAGWIAVLDVAAQNCQRDQKGMVATVSLKDISRILKKIERHRVNLGTFSGILKQEIGVSKFEDFLKKSNSEALLRFWLDLKKFKKEFSEAHANSDKGSRVIGHVRSSLAATGSHQSSSGTVAPQHEEKQETVELKGASVCEDEDANLNVFNVEDCANSTGDEFDLLGARLEVNPDDATGSSIHNLDDIDFDLGHTSLPRTPDPVPQTRMIDNLPIVEIRETNSKAAQMIYDRFIRHDSDESLERFIVMDSVLKFDIGSQLDNPSQEMFLEVQTAVADILKKKFNTFLEDPVHENLVKSIRSAGDFELSRNIEPFPPNMSMRFVTLESKRKPKGMELDGSFLSGGESKSPAGRTYKFPSNKTTATLGRDNSNDFILNDPNISRSHARLEFTETECIFFDSGSSAGSKVNGKTFQFGNLKDGDVLEIGKTRLEFRLVPRKKGLLSRIRNH